MVSLKCFSLAAFRVFVSRPPTRKREEPNVTGSSGFLVARAKVIFLAGDERTSSRGGGGGALRDAVGHLESMEGEASKAGDGAEAGGYRGGARAGQAGALSALPAVVPASRPCAGAHVAAFGRDAFHHADPRLPAALRVRGAQGGGHHNLFTRPLGPVGAVFKINRCFVRGKPCSAKATEAEVAQRAIPPRATPAQLGFPLTRRAQAEQWFILKTAPRAAHALFREPSY